jgi:hypothetical protein
MPGIVPANWEVEQIIIEREEERKQGLTYDIRHPGIYSRKSAALLGEFGASCVCLS